jgi:hypothetical protein
MDSGLSNIEILSGEVEPLMEYLFPLMLSPKGILANHNPKY